MSALYKNTLFLRLYILPITFDYMINVDQYVCKGYKGFMHSRKQSRTINQQTQKQCNLRMHKDSCKGKILRAL